MDELIAGFVRRLRRQGMAVSPAEGIDAARAALAVGLESKVRFRWALRATLVKSLEVQGLFDEAFSAHFKAPRPSPGKRRGKGREPGQGAGRHRPEDPEPGRGRRPGKRRSSPPEEPRGHPRRPTGPRGRVLSARRRRGRVTGVPVRREIRRLDFIEPALLGDEERMAGSIADLVREIRLRPGRRYGRGRRGRLWIKRMVRESLSRGGVPFTLPMKTRRPRRPRVVILVDVSWSVARAAGLFLLLVRGLSDRLGSCSVHLFVDRTIDATREVDRWARGQAEAPAPSHRLVRRPPPGSGVRPAGGGVSFSALVDSLRDLNPGAASDYGRAFHQAAGRLLPGGARDTVLVVLGDARSNRRDPLPWAFQEIAQRCRRVLWLNPEPRHLWDSGDSVMSEYLPYCDVACEIRDLDGLSRGVREMVRSL